MVKFPIHCLYTAYTFYSFVLECRLILFVVPLYCHGVYRALTAPFYPVWLLFYSLPIACGVYSTFTKTFHPVFSHWRGIKKLAMQNICHFPCFVMNKLKLSGYKINKIPLFSPLPTPESTVQLSFTCINVAFQIRVHMVSFSYN